MEIKKTVEGGKLTVVPVGRVDTLTAPELEEALALDNVTELVVDLAQLEYISSAGLRVLLSAQKRMNRQGDMLVLNLKPAVKEVFDITGFSDIFTLA